MNEGIRFERQYGSMPWHKIDVVVFDIGNVLIRFAPDDFLQQLFPDDPVKQEQMLHHVYQGKYWPMFDRGTMEYAEAVKRLAAEFGGSEADYMHALRGWIELKTPLEEGWRAARRCRRAGKKLYLLSNYPREGYIRLREKFADLFDDLFDGGVISWQCHEMKPEAAIYERLIGQCGAEPGRMLFIDDTEKNIDGAMACGINGFHMREAGMMDKFFI